MYVQLQLTWHYRDHHVPTPTSLTYPAPTHHRSSLALGTALASAYAIGKVSNRARHDHLSTRPTTF